MSSVYMIDQDGETLPMEQFTAVDEDVDLQRLLEKNPDLLPGDQIRPEDPRRWLLIKREMPVQDPGTGAARWSIDFFFADQDAIPTFVECKRFLDTRARREVVGQMLEYAANGHYYWTRETLREYATAAAASRGSSIGEAIQMVAGEGTEADAFLETLENNLREGQVRLVFFLDQTTPELKSIVDFLNRQMERSEILLVEARQYERAGTRVVVPTLFGYTEQARRVKKTVTVTSSRRRWREEDYFAHAAEHLAPEDVAGLRRLYAECARLGYEIRWGTGASEGSFNVLLPRVSSASLLSVFSRGRIALNFGGLSSTESGRQLQRDFLDRAAALFGDAIPGDAASKYPTIQRSEWLPKLDGLLELLTSLRDRYRG